MIGTRESDNVTLECRDQNFVPEEVAIVDLDGIMQVSPLVITSIQNDEAGVYLCVVSRDGETLSTPIEVVIVGEY